MAPDVAHAHDSTTHERYDPVRQRHRLLGLVRRQEDRGALGHHLGDDLAEHRPGGSVEPGMRLVEEPQLGPTGHEQREGHPPALARGQTTHRGATHPSPELQSLEHGVDVRHAGAGGPYCEAHVLGDGQIVVEGGGMAEHAHPAAQGGGIPAQVDPEHRALAPRQW